jgi:diguanylate cyclase (GGDEF)-like protein
VERDANGLAVRAIGTSLDITGRKTDEEQIRQLAYYDTLTNLPNRRLLQDRLNQVLSQSRRFRRSLAIMFLDLDHFKLINDRFGHDAGDELLKEVATRLSECVRAGDTVSRQGGDEFVIILAEIRDSTDASRVADKIFKALERPVHIGDQEIIVNTSIGISVYSVDGADDAQELLKKADNAMYAAKKAGRNRYCFFEPSELCTPQ